MTEKIQPDHLSNVEELSVTQPIGGGTSSVLELSGTVKHIEILHLAPVDSLGFSPTGSLSHGAEDNKDVKCLDVTGKEDGSNGSNDGIVLDSQEHPGMGKINLESSAFQFCSYVNRNPIPGSENSQDYSNSLISEGLSIQNSLPDPVIDDGAIPQVTPEEALSSLKRAQSIFDASLDQPSAKRTKAFKQDSNFIETQKAGDLEIGSPDEDIAQLQSIIFPVSPKDTFAEDEVILYNTECIEAGFRYNPPPDFFETSVIVPDSQGVVEDSLEAEFNIAYLGECDNEEALPLPPFSPSSPIVQTSEPDDCGLLLKEDAKGDFGNTGNGTKEETFSKFSFENVEVNIDVLANTKANASQGNTILGVVSNSSSEFDDTTDEDYQPSQQCSIMELNAKPIKSAKKSQTKRTKILRPSSSRSRMSLNLSSDLGLPSSTRKKVTFQNNEKKEKKKIFSGIDFMISVKEKGLGPDSWLQDKEKVSKRIKNNGGNVVANATNGNTPLLKSFFRGRKRIKDKGREMIMTSLAPLRTKKYLLALALGLPIVSTVWIKDCIDKRELLDYNGYRLCNGHSAILKDQCSARASEDPLFAGLTFFIFGRDNSDKKVISDWKELLEHAEAKVISLKEFDLNDNNVYVLVLEERITTQERGRFGKRVVTLDYIIQCLIHQSLLPMDRDISFIPSVSF